MVIASMAIRLLPLRRIACGRDPTAQVATGDELSRIRRAIRAWSRRLPWRTKCFEEGVTAHWLLRRRGFQSTLYYGAATIDGELKAHVWVRSGSVDVVGCDSADDYVLLAQSPG
ncbi:MAG: lasso peptide biosynthesis B2 protein [Sphingomicrobium sp.]